MPQADSRIARTATGRVASLCAALALAVLTMALAPERLQAQSVAQTPAGNRAAEDARGVPYVTLRNRTGSTDPASYYGDARSAPKAGWCDLRLRDLEALVPLTDMLPDFLDEDMLRVTRLRETSRDAVLRDLADTASGRAPLLYTHGYYISFEKGCRRATLFQENAGLGGRLMWFSWPSDGALFNYTRDEADLYWSVPDLAEMIDTMARRFPDQRLDVVGHSLGARGVVLAMAEIARKQPDRRIGHVVLLAPDMDFDIFRRMLPDIRSVAASITVYVNSGDGPLAVSSQLHGYPRLGEAGNPVGSLAGVEVVDVSALNDTGPTGHLYHFLSPTVGADIDRLLNDGTRAEDRAGLREAGPNLWRLMPGDAGSSD